MIYAAWLLEGTPGGPDGRWDKAALEAKIKEGASYNINLAKAVPVIWVYLTGWSNGDGPADFRDDVYNIDNVGEAAGQRPGGAGALKAQRFSGGIGHDPGDERGDVLAAVGQPHPLDRRRPLGQRQPRPPFTRGPDRPGREAAAAIGAHIA